MNIIYISNARIPSEKANTYQSMVMCEAFANNGCNVEFWYSYRKNSKKMNNIDNVFEYYNVNKKFELKEIFTIDSMFLKFLNEKIWFVIRTLIFNFNYVKKLRSYSNNYIILTRDHFGLQVLLFAKKYGLIKQRVFFEAHKYTKNISKLVKDIDGLIVINNYLKKLYEKDGIKNIFVAHDGVKLEEYQNIKYKKVKNKNIVYVGNLFQWKGVYILADSMKYLQDYKLTIVGGSPETLLQFEKYIKNNKIKNIELIGFVKKEDTIKYIEKADVVVLPNSSKDKMSYYTSPLKLFEYMASKRVIVASRLPSIEEVLEDKKNAILFEPDNPKNLAEKIRWCFENDTAQIIEQAYKDVQNYTWDKRANNIKRWILKCVE